MRNAKVTQIRTLCISSLCKPKPQLYPGPVTIPTAEYPSNSSSTSLSTNLQQYINSDSPSHGLKIHSHILKTGYKPNKNISIKLLILHLKSGFVSYARQLLEEMSHPTLTAYNYLLNAYVKHGQGEEAFDLVRRMCDFDEKPDSFTHSLILKAWASVPRPLFLTCDIGSGCVEDADALFKEITEKDVVVFNAMIEGYSKSIDTAKKSLEIYIEMRRLNFLPTISTFASLIGACSLLTAVEISQQVQTHLMKTKYFADVKIGSALIDMYSKCGKVDDARQIFNYMPEKNIFSWTSMIDGYGKNGKPIEVIELFGKMRGEHQVKPNYVTFLCAISACAYTGLVDKGWEIFESMEKDYHLLPQMEHYACMVDLLGRSGNIEQAREFVMRMPEKPNSDVWASFLSSCRLHGELEMASMAADELFKLCADGRPGSYVALSNALAAAGRWDCVNEIRELMKQRGISKDTGFSWTGTDDGPKWFHAGLSCG